MVFARNMLALNWIAARGGPGWHWHLVLGYYSFVPWHQRLKRHRGPCQHHRVQLLLLMYGFVFGIPDNIIFPIVKIVLFVIYWRCAIETLGKTRGSSVFGKRAQSFSNIFYLLLKQCIKNGAKKCLNKLQPTGVGCEMIELEPTQQPSISALVRIWRRRSCHVLASELDNIVTRQR